MKAEQAVLCVFLLPLAMLVASFGITRESRSQVPDSVDAALYFPLSSGNQWHFDASPGTIRWMVLADTTLDGQTYFELFEDSVEEDGSKGTSRTYLLRYDTLSATMMEYVQLGQGYEESWFALPGCLDAPFTNTFDCDSTNDRYTILRPEWQNYGIGGDTLDAPHAKVFDTLGGSYSFIASVGLVHRTFEGTDASMDLVFAKLGGWAVGSPVFASGSESTDNAASRLRIIASLYPNPTVDGVTVAVVADSPQICAIRVLDLTGRIIRSEPLTVAASRQFSFDLTALAAGVYFIQVDTCGESEVRRIVVL